MKKTLLVGAALCAIASPLLPQTQVAGGTIITPQSSIARPQDLGVRAHTFIHIFIPAGGLPVKAPAPIEGAANTPGGFFETPASLACVYKIVATSPGCTACCSSPTS